MNRFLLPALLWCTLSTIGFAQGVEIYNQVIASAGKSGAQGNYKVSYTVGEMIISTVSSANNTLTQGFHQPGSSLVFTTDPALAAWNIEVFPNPTENTLYIRFAAEKSGELRANVYDLLGRTVLSEVQLPQTGLHQIDCAEWQAGVYFLQLRSSTTSGAAMVRFVRL